MLTLATSCGIAERDLNIINEVMTGCVCSKFLLDYFFFFKRREEKSTTFLSEAVYMWQHVLDTLRRMDRYTTSGRRPNQRSESGTCGDQRLRRSFHV